MKKSFRFFILITALLLTGISCGKKKNQSVERILLSKESTPLVSDTLRAVTLYGPTTYFNYRGQDMGFEYENIKRFAEDEGLILDLKVAPNMQTMLKMLEEGDADVAAYPVPYIEEYKEDLIHCGNREITWQVLVQHDKDNKIDDVTELIGKTVYVEENSKYYYRMINLDEELGGGINIVTLSKDSLVTEDVLDMVNKDEIPLTVVDSDVAALNKAYYPSLDTDLKVSLEQYSSWAVNKGNEDLAERIDNWNNKKKTTEELKQIYKKYFEISKDPNSDLLVSLNFKDMKRGQPISRYDELFKRYAPEAGFPWYLLAAVAYNESHFDPTAVSPYGATGLMQIMPTTAKSKGINPNQLFNPEMNILAGARTLRHLNESLSKKIPDPDERLKFILASYNAGQGHVNDAMALAEKYGMDPTIWFGQVSEAALMKSNPKYYNDPVVKHGYFRGRETVNFVEKVMATYLAFKNVAD